MSIAKISLCLFFLLIAMAAFTQQAERFDVVITEIMADPGPVVGLPNAEYIEIKNRSSKSFLLSGWKLGDASSTGIINSAYVLKPDSMVILCSNSQLSNFVAFGKAIGVTGMPSLDNDADLLSLQSPQGKWIHAVEYSSSWFPNSLKKEGGWSLEMIDTNIPCLGEKNWTASSDLSGGTPGRINASNGSTTDHDPPQLLRTYNSDSLTMIAVFDEPLDSGSASDITRYSINENMSIINVTPIAPLFRKVAISLANPFQKAKLYSLKVHDITDCMNNPVGAFNTAKAGWAEEPSGGDLLINEILFNPALNSSDFVELYNHSGKILDASKVFIANRNGAGEIASAKKICETIFNIYPGEHIVVTEDINSLKSNYLVKEPGYLLQLSSLPSFPDDNGFVVITNAQGIVLEEVPYSDKWHFSLISNAEGVSLERIDPLKDASDPANWHSASSTDGYATPTYRNSQWIETIIPKGKIQLNQLIFSPDNDGFDDVAIIDYNTDGIGYIANITIFDAMGRPVRLLVKNGLMGMSGRWTWDGLDENRKELPVGSYIIYTELFNLQGGKTQHKNTIVLARKLR